MERELGSLILATDISRQNDYLSRFRTHLDQDSLCLNTASHRHFVLQVRYISAASAGPHIVSKPAGSYLVCLSTPVQMALKCADICNPCRPWELSKQWSEKVTEEFFQQGICFMTYVAEPLFGEWARFSDTRLSQTMLGHMGLNKASWAGLQQEQTTAEEAELSAAGADAGGSHSKEIPQGSREY
ncbi:hypothetical protein GOODEAATRI_028839 [Goodea atripinnis]|uniref:PDEase domain-containing protein n=1 Tax=Goodea atripinnis TaxID=208336 RepID=A0ABV0MLJ1_9TELE